MRVFSIFLSDVYNLFVEILFYVWLLLLGFGDVVTLDQKLDDDL